MNRLWFWNEYVETGAVSHKEMWIDGNFDGKEQILSRGRDREINTATKDNTWHRKFSCNGTLLQIWVYISLSWPNWLGPLGTVWSILILQCACVHVHVYACLWIFLCVFCFPGNSANKCTGTIWDDCSTFYKFHPESCSTERSSLFLSTHLYFQFNAVEADIV